MTIRDIMVSFGFDVDRSSERKVEGSIKGLKNMASNLLRGIAVVFSVAGLSDLAGAAADVEALESQFSQVFGDMEQDAAAKLDKIADDTGILANRMKGSFTQIAAFSKTTGLEEAEALDIANRSMIAVADSAAFYDKSIENMTESLQSFLKGNYENDAALGISCTETTRNAAANELYSKSFKDLSEAEKQLTLLKMVEDGNRLSGALGQAARESDTWTNQLGNLKQSILDLKATAGSTILKPAVMVLKLLTAMAQGAAKKIQTLTGETGIVTRAFDRFHALIKRLRPELSRTTETLNNGMQKGAETGKGMISLFGGVENALKLAAIVAAAFFIAMNWSGIIEGARKFMKLLSGIGKLFGPSNMKLLGLIALITLLFLIVDDFINFMKGNDSVIGHCFEKAGIDADEMRAKIKNIWENLKEFFGGIWESIKTAAAPILDQIKKMIKNVFGEDLFAGLGTGVAGIIEFLERLTGALAKNKGLQDFLGKAVVAIIAVVTAINIAIPVIHGVIALIGIVKGVIAGVGAVIGFLTSPIGLVVAAIVALIAIGVLLYKNWDEIKAYALSIWTAICDFFSGLLESIKSTFSSALEYLSILWQTVWSTVSGFFMSIWNGILSFLEGVVSGISSTVSNIRETIVNGLQSAIDWIRALPSQAVQWGADFINGLRNGILSGVQGIVNAVKGIGDRIKSFLHFSVPDEGPLTDYESWMPDFMGGLAKGISDNEDTVLDKVKRLAGGISVLMKGATASAATAGATAVRNTTSNVTQNVNIDNTYNGGSMEAQKNVSKAMDKSAVDATTQMARALAYARG